MITRHGLNMVGTSREDTQCISRIDWGLDRASPAPRLLVFHPTALTPNNFFKEILIPYLLSGASWGGHVSWAPHPMYCPLPFPRQRVGTNLPPLPLRRRCWQLLGRKKRGGGRRGGGGNVEAGGCNHPSCCLFPQTNSRAIRVGEFNQRLSFPGTISPNENLIFFYRTLLH